ncbi:hypothetical protein Tco_0746474 [Tanacetum coccineum]
MSNVKKSVVERTRHKTLYDRRMNKRKMLKQDSKVDSGKALDVDLVVTESSGTESEVQDESNRSGNDTDTDDADMRPIYDEEPMAEVQLTGEYNIFATGQQHTEQPKIINECRVYYVAKLLAENELLNKENDTLKKYYKELYDSIKTTRAKTIEHTTSLITQNADLKAQIQEKVFAIAALKNKLRKLKGNIVDTKFTKPSILGKPFLQSLKNQSVVRQPIAFKSERPRILKPWFASQVDVKNNLSNPSHHIIFLKDENQHLKTPHHVTALANLRKAPKTSKISTNDMVHNHYLDEAKKKTQKRKRNSKSSVMHTASLQNTTNGSKPKPRSNNQTSRSLLVSKSSCVTITAVIIVDHYRNPKLESLFDPLFDEYFNEENQVILKSSSVITADAPDKRQQQRDSTSFTSTLATTVTANGNFDL